jgi:hypothetical protein
MGATASAIARGDVRPEIRDFIVAFAEAGDRGPDESAALFCDTFLSLDPSSARPVTAEQLAASLPMRAALFASIGAQGTELVEFSEQPIDAHHTLLRTAWRVRFADSDAEPLTLESSYLLHRGADGWRIAVYLNHADIVAVIRERQARGDANG